MAHHHFTRDDRVFLVKLITKGLSVHACARILGFHPSTIYRELARGRATTSTGYSVKVAREHAQSVRRAANQQHRKLWQKQADALLSLIRQDYSPEQAGHTWLVCRIPRSTAGSGISQRLFWRDYGNTCAIQSSAAGTAPNAERSSEN